MTNFLTALFVIACGAGLTVLGIIAEIAWITFLFGSVIGVVLVLIFAPPLFLLPLALCQFGLTWIAGGIGLLRQGSGATVIEQHEPELDEARLRNRARIADLEQELIASGHVLPYTEDDAPKTEKESEGNYYSI